MRWMLYQVVCKKVMERVFWCLLWAFAVSPFALCILCFIENQS